MAEFWFYGTWDDAVAWLQMLCQMRRFTFVVDKWYTVPVAEQFITLDEERLELVRKHSKLFLWADAYSRFPPFFGKPTPNALLRIDLPKGGPALELWVPDCFERDGRLCLRQGDLAYLPQFQNPETGEWYEPPHALKQAYEELRTLLRKSMVKRFAWGRRFTGGDFKPVIETYWLGRHAAQLLDEGKAGILEGLERLWRTGSDFYKRKSEIPEPPEDE